MVILKEEVKKYSLFVSPLLEKNRERFFQSHPDFQTNVANQEKNKYLLKSVWEGYFFNR